MEATISRHPEHPNEEDVICLDVTIAYGKDVLSNSWVATHCYYPVIRTTEGDLLNMGGIVLHVDGLFSRLLKGEPMMVSGGQVVYYSGGIESRERWEGEPTSAYDAWLPASLVFLITYYRTYWANTSHPLLEKCKPVEITYYPNRTVTHVIA